MKAKFYVFLLFSAIVWICCKTDKKESTDYTPGVAIVFNNLILETAIAEDNLLTLKGLRTLTMAHLAMHDALNSIVPKFDSYVYHEHTPNADPLSAVAYAAYEVAADQYPDKRRVFDSIVNNYYSGKGENNRMGKTLGQAAAQAVLKKRNEDRWNGEKEYTLHPMAPGVYAEFNEHSGTPEGFVFGAGWSAAQPFALPRPDHFRAPLPPKINSPEYTRAFEEVRTVGGSNSTVRTADQSHLAMWWKEFSESSHNALLRDLVVKENMGLWEATRTFALMNMAIYDAYINVFDNKFHYNHWRPYTAIRWAAHDGNEDTHPDEEWNNLHKHTYPFPSYPSAHGTASTSAMTVLARTLGKGDNYAFTMTQVEVDSAGFFSGKMKMDPPTRSFNSFSEAGLEASMSRVYLGIHFRYDSEEGNKLGAKIGNFTSDNFLKPLQF